MTLFAVIGFFKPGVDTSPARLQSNFNEHLGQSSPHIRLAGYLRDHEAKAIGFMGLVEADSFERAQAYLGQSPYFEAGLYREAHALEYAVEVGRLP